MDKQIKEMAKIVVEKAFENYETSGSVEIDTEVRRNCYFAFLVYCEALYNTGYRKIPENAVVLTREEQQRYAAYKIIEPQIRGCLDRERELEKRLETVRKETAEKFAEKLFEVFDEYFLYDRAFINRKINEICKEMVEGK